MPPAATTGTGATASTTAGTSARVAVRAADVAAGLPALGDDDVGAGLGGAHRFGDAADAHHQEGAGVVDAPGERRGIAPEQRDDGHALVEHRLDLLGDVEGEHDIGDEGPVGRLAQAPDPGARLFAAPAGEAERAEAAGVRDRGGERRPGGAADRGLDHGDVDSEPFAERRAHRNPSAPDGEV